MAVSDYKTQDIQVGTNTYVKPVNTAVAQAVEVIGSGLAAVNKQNELEKFEAPVRQMEENVMKLGAGAPQEALFIQGSILESKLANGLLSEDQMSEADKKLLNDSRSMILREDLAVKQGRQKITDMQISAEKWLRENIRRRPDLAPEFRAIIRNELGMDVEGAAMQDYLSQLKALEDKDKPSLTFSNLNDILTPIEKYAKENGSAAGAAEIAQEAINIRLLYGKDPSAAIAGAEALAKGISSDTKYVSIKAVDSAEAKLAQVEKSLADDLAKPLPTTEADLLARTENSRVFKNNLNILKEELAALSFSAGSDVGKKRDAIIGRINGIIEDYYDPEKGEYSPAKYVTLRTAETVANETAADKAPLAKLSPLVSFLDEPTQKNVMTAVSIGSKLTNEGMGYIDNPAISSKITGQMVNNGLNGLASSAGNLQASIKNNPEGHLASFIDVTAPFTYEVYTDKAKTSRVYVPASEFMSASSGVLPRIARSLVPNGYVDKLYNESGQPEAVDITLGALVTRASETMYRELGKTNLPNVSYTKQDGTVMSSSEVLRTYFAPVDYKSSIAGYYEQGSPKTFKLTSSGEPVLLRPNTRLTALPTSEQKKLFAVWDAYNAEAERRYPVGVESFATIFYKLNDRVTGGGTE